MKIEILYPEFCNLNGDMGNIQYLKRCLPEAKIIETAIHDKPAFSYEEDISLIYMWTLSERSQEIVIQKLRSYKEKIQELIDAGQVFLFTGNSIEILGEDRKSVV